MATGWRTFGTASSRPRRICAQAPPWRRPGRPPMFPLFRSLTVRYLLQKWDRAALVALSIALGVATLVSARLLNQCVEAAALDSTVPADIAHLYVDNGEAGVERAIVNDIQKAGVPGVERAEPFVVARVILPDLGNRYAVVFGLSVAGRSASDARHAEKLKVSVAPVANPAARP